MLFLNCAVCVRDVKRHLILFLMFYKVKMCRTVSWRVCHDWSVMLWRSTWQQRDGGDAVCTDVDVVGSLSMTDFNTWLLLLHLYIVSHSRPANCERLMKSAHDFKKTPQIPRVLHMKSFLILCVCVCVCFSFLWLSRYFLLQWWRPVRCVWCPTFWSM